MVHDTSRRRSQTIDAQLLRVLAAAPASGFTVTKRLSAAAPHQLEARAIYSGLHRLESQGMVAAEWRIVPGHSHEAKYYRVTRAGVRRLDPSRRDASPASITFLSMLLMTAVIWPEWIEAFPSPAGRPHLTILMDSEVAVSPAEWRLAVIDVARILGAIGVRVDFGDGSRSAGCVIHVVIASGASERSLSHEVPLGITLEAREDGRAEVRLFHDHIREFADLHRKTVPVVLALVLAHEIGHALLPAPAHSRAGIMQTPWDRQEIERADVHELLFTSQQGALIRERLNRCCASRARQ